MTEQPSSTPSLAVAHRHLSAPLAHLGAWTQYFRHADIAVLAVTAQALEQLRAIEDDVDANRLTAVIQSDPLMTLKLLAHVASLRRPGADTETESISSALVMVGIAPFFRRFGPQPTVEDWLADQPLALQGVRELLKRAERAGQFALGFAVHRGDTDAAIIHQAAFLNDFADILIWLHAPTLALQMARAQAANPTLRSSTIQKAVLGIEITDLRQSLMQLWALPELLQNISDERHAERPSVQCVLLAVRLARHTALNWDNPAVPDDVADLARLFNAPPKVVLAFLHKIDHPVIEATGVSDHALPDDFADTAPYAPLR